MPDITPFTFKFREERPQGEEVRGKGSSKPEVRDDAVRQAFLDQILKDTTFQTPV
jgi:hypothetical protein